MNQDKTGLLQKSTSQRFQVNILLFLMLLWLSITAGRSGVVFWYLPAAHLKEYRKRKPRMPAVIRGQSGEEDLDG